MVQPIRQFDDPILKQVCEPVQPGEDLRWIFDLRDTCLNVGNGYGAAGLAAPQIGVPKRVIFIQYGRTMGCVLINPELDTSSDRKGFLTEMCLSYPGVKARIERPASIWCTWFGFNQQTGIIVPKPSRRIFREFDARVLQHECDHLNGVCRVGDVWRTEKESRAALGLQPAVGGTP